ncbi:hypothetical protein ACGF5O_26665 [Streptomyces sp. NPDC048291]|uniref:hypothetical protein n=1 Tax=Streptomyces sp. NPDC048291 TaxID=3365530 RepID=UPI003720C2FA
MPRPTDWNAIGLDSDPTPGEPDQIRTLSTELNHLGSEARRISTAIDAVMNTAGDSVFVGEAADALRGKVNDRLRGHIEDVAQSFESAATALSTWADKLVDLQSRADGALNSGRGLSEDDPDRETYAATARQAGTEHGEGASAAAGSISGVSNIQLPISECQIFWEAFQWLAIILIVPALIFGGPIALLALGVNLTLFIKTIVDFANGNASFLDLFLAGLGILAPTTKALPIFQIIKSVGTTAFAKGFANIARGTFQALRNLFTNGFRPTTLLLGLKDLVRLGSTWVFKGGLWVLDGIHNLPNVISHGVNSLGLTVVQGFKAIPGFVRGLPETLSRGWQATKTWVGQEFGGTKWLRILLPVDAAEIGEYGFARALRISLFDRGVLGRHVFGAPITSGIGRTISSVPVDPRTVDALVDMPRIQLNEVRFGAGSGPGGIRNLDLNIPSTHLDVTSTLRPPSLNLGDVGAIAHRGNFGVHAARTVDALVDMPHVQLGTVRVENFGALGGHSELGVSAGATPTVTTASGLHVPASAGVPGATHGITNSPVTAVSGGAHTTLTGLPPAPANLTSHADVLLPGGAHNATHVPGSTVLTGTHSAPPPVAATLGDLSTANPTAGTLHSAFTGTPGVGTVHAPGTPGIGAAPTTLTGTPGTNIAHRALDSAPAPGAPHDVTAPHSLLTGPTTVAHPSPAGLGHGGPGHVDTGVSAFDLLAGTRHNTPHSPVSPGTGDALADRTTSALNANQTRLHLDELVHQPGSPRPGSPAERLPHGSPSPAPGTPDRLTIPPVSPDRLTTSPANPITSDRLTVTAGPHQPAPGPVGGSGRPGTGGDHSRSALDLVDTGRSARATDSPAFAGTPAHTDADKGLAGSATGTSGHAPEHLPERGAGSSAPPSTSASSSSSAGKYKLQFDESVLGHVGNDFDGVKVVTDRTSAPYLSGASVDFADTVEKQGFTIDMPSGSAGHGGDAFDAAPAAAHSDGLDQLLKDPDIVRVPGDHPPAVQAPHGGTPELHGGTVSSLPTPTSWGKELPGRGPRLTPAQIEEAWFRDGQRVDALFGHADDPLRQARREAWRDHVQARYDLGRAEDLLPHNGHAGSSKGPTAAEIHARENVDTARQQYDATHGRLAELGIDPVRMEAQLSDLRQLSLNERPRALGGTSLPADDATPPPAHSAPGLHSETEAAAPLTPPQQLSKSLGEHTEAQRGVQQAENNLANAGANQRPAMQAALDKANDEASRIAVRLDEDMTQALTDGRLSQRDLNLLVDQFAGAGDIQRALRFQRHALSLDAQARHAPETAGADHFIKTGKEIEQQSLELRGLTQRLENLVTSGKKAPLELQGLARTLDKAADDLDASLKGFVKDAAGLGGVYTLRNEHSPVSTVAHELARKVDDAVKAARPGDSIALKGFHGTEFSISRLQRDMPEVARHLRSNKAYAEVHTGNQWRAELPGSQEQWKKVFPEFEDFEKLSDAQKTHFVQELSERNITQLRQDVREVLDSLPPAERAQFEKLLTSLENLPYRVKHATPAYHAIANSGVMSSQGDLTRRGIRFMASGKSSGKNTSNLGNDDFVFFRMEAGDKPMATRYGPTTLVFDAKVLEERGGWVSLHDQLHPLDREAMRDLKFGEDTVRSAKYDDGFEEMGKRARWTYEYPGGAESSTVSFEQEVFHGAHVQEALALSVVREVHRIGGGFKDDVLKLVQGPVDVEKMGAVVSKLYRPEAKFGSGLPINPFSSQVESRWPKPLQVHDAEGDGRYLADGTVDPAARAAGKAFDEASDKVRQADNAVSSGNRKAQRYNLNKAQPLAEQAVKLTQEFHDIAQGARKDMAKGLLDERTKLLDDINGRIGALKGQPDTDAVKTQPRPGRSQGAAASSSAAPMNGPNLNALPQAAENALNAVTGITDHMKKMVRALANSDGFRALPDSRVGAQTTAAVDLGRTAFGKAFKNLAGEGLVRGDADGLHLTDKGRALFLPPGAETRTSAPSVSAATDVHSAPAHARPQLPHSRSGPDTKAPALTDDGFPTHSPDTTLPAPHDLDTGSPAPHHTGTDTLSPAPHDLDVKSPAPHGTDTQSPAPHPVDAEAAPPPVKEGDTTVSHSSDHAAAAHPLDAKSAPQHLSDTTTAHLADTDTRTPRLADTDTTPPHPTETDKAATHLDDVHPAGPHHGDGGDFSPVPPRDGTRLGDSVLDDMLGPPRRTGDTTGTTAPGTAHPAAADLLDRAAFRRSTYRENGIRARSQIRYVDGALDAFHRVPADRLAGRAEALDNLAEAAQRFLRDRPDSVRRDGVAQLLHQVRAEADAYRLLDDFRRLGGDGDGLAGHVRTALAAGGTTPHTQTRLQTMLDGMDRSAQAQRQNDALSLLDGTPPPFRSTGDTTLTAPTHRPGETPWAQDSARFDALLGGDGRPFREAWVELSSARVELNRVEELRGAPGGASTSRGVSEFDVQLNHELVSARERFRTAYTNLEDLGVRPTEIEARIGEIERDATRRGATLGAGTHDTLPDTAPPAVHRVDLNNSGVSGPNGLTVERSVGQDGTVTLRVVDQQSHPDPTRTVVARPDGGFDVRNTQSDTVETYTANGDRTAYEMPLRGADGRPTGLRLHTDINGHGTRQALTVNGPGADRLTAFPLPGDAARITHLDTGVTRRVDALGLRLDEGVQLTGRDGVPAGTDRVRVTDGADVHVTDLAGDRLDLRVQDLGDGNGVRVTDETTGVSVRHDGRGRLQETGVSLADPRGARGERFLADDGPGRFTLTDPSGARQPQTVTALPDGAGFRVTDGTSGATSRFTADGRYRDTGLALFDPAANARGGRVVVPDGTGGHRLTDAAGQPLPERVVAVGGNRPRTIHDVTGESVLYDVQGRPVSTSTALADPAGGPRGARFAEPDGVGGHRLTDADGNRLPDTVTALPDDGGFRTVHDTGHRTFAPNGDLAGDGLRLTGRDGVPAGHLDRPVGAAPRWLDDAFAADPARAVTLDPAGRIEIARPGGGRQVFDQNTGRFVQETVQLPGGGHQTTLADGTFTRYDGQGAVAATGTPLPVGHGGRRLVVEPPTAQHPGAWLEDAAGGRLAHWDAVRRPDGTTRIGFNDLTSPRHGEFVHLAADGSVARQGFNVLDNGRRTDYRYVVDHTTNTWERTTRSGAPVATGSFQHGTADLSGAAGGHVKLLSSTKKQVPVFERRVLPGAPGGVVDSFRRTDTIDFARTNPRTHWVRWDDTGTPVGTGSRRYDTAGTGWRDTDGWGRTVREYRDGLQKFNGRTGHTLGVDDGNGAWTWHRYDGDGRVIASGPRTREHVGSGWTDRTADGRIAQRQWGMAEWPERAGQYQEHALNPADGSLRATWERHSPHGKEVGKHEAFGDGFLTTDRWREQRPPTLVRTRWLAGAEHVRPPYAHVRADDTYQLFTWTKEAGDGATTSGVRYVGMDGSALDLAADGTFARFSGKLYDGTSLKVGDHAARPGHPPADPGDHPWQAGDLRGYRQPLANDAEGRLWQDVYQDAGGVTRTAREGRPNGVVREFTGDRTWVDRDPHGNLVGQSHANPDGTAGRVVEGSGRADSGRWTWRELDAQGAELGSGRREFFRGSNDSRLPWDDSYRDYDGNGNLVRERRMLDSGRYVDAWRDNQGDWRVSAHERNGTPVAVGNGEQVRRWWDGRAWQDRWTDGARHFRDELRVPGQAAPTVLRETPLHNGGPLRVRAYSTTVTQNTPAGSVWKEFDHGSVVRERKADGGGFLETDAWRGQWNRYSRNGDLIGQRTDNGLVFERDSFGRMRLTGNEYDFRGALTEIRGWGRTTREAQRMPWSGTLLPDGDAALREARYEPYWQSVAKKAALEFGQEFILEFGANLAVNGIVAAVQNKPFTGKDALKSFANAAVGATVKTGLSTAVHENRALGFEKLGQFKAGIANVDGGKPWTRRPLNHDKTWVNEWAGNETPTRWRGGTYDFSFGVLSSALSGWVNGSMNAAVWGVTNADGQTVKLHGGDAVWEGGINAAASVTTAATTGLVKNVFVMSAGSRLFHRQGFADFWIQLPFKIFEKTIQSLYLTSTYRASINPTYYQAP